MLRRFLGTGLVMGALAVMLSACEALGPGAACRAQGLSTGSQAYAQCVADRTAAARQTRLRRPRHDHGR